MAKKGYIPWNKGKKTGITSKTIFKKGRKQTKRWYEIMKNKKPWNKGKKGLQKPSEETRKKMSETHLRIGNQPPHYKGSKNPNWKGGVSRLKIYKHYKDKKYIDWRSKVFERDNWTCQTCEARSKAGEPVYLVPHHIKGWTKYPEFRYKVNNGITLCLKCHKLHHKLNGYELKV